MKIPVLLLANEATVENHLLNVRGGGWTNYSCQTFPWGVGGTICGVLRMEAADRAEPQRLSFSVRDQSGHVLGSLAEIVVESTAGDGPSESVFAIPFNFVVEDAILATFAVSRFGPDRATEELASVDLPIRPLPSNL